MSLSTVLHTDVPVADRVALRSSEDANFGDCQQFVETPQVRTSAARGVILGVLLGAALWAAILIFAGSIR